VRVRLHDLLGRRVVDCERRRLGRVVDVRASRHEDELRVDALLVGTRAGLARVMQTRWVERRRLRVTVPWEHVDALDDPIRLSITAHDVREIDARLDEELGWTQ